MQMPLCFCTNNLDACLRYTAINFRKKLKQYCSCLTSHKTHESQATIQLQHTRMFYYPVLTIASQSFDSDKYSNLHYYRVKSS